MTLSKSPRPLEFTWAADRLKAKYRYINFSRLEAVATVLKWLAHVIGHFDVITLAEMDFKLTIDP
jgi:hypothetical protein